MNQCKMFARVNSIETMGLVDGPGIRVVVFLQGCNLRCLYCHNPETWSKDSKNIVSVDDVVSRVLKYKNYIQKNGGVTFSGGEPLLQSDFIYECARRLKKEDIHICVDTAGVAKGYEKIIDLVDLFIVDVKSIYEDEYKYITGSNMDLFNGFIEKIQKYNKKIWIRQVIVPGINDNEKHVIDLAKFCNNIKGIERVELLPYHTLGKEKYKKLNVKYRLEKVKDLDNDKFDYLRKILSEHLVK